MEKKNYQSNKTKKNKGSAIITGIAIFLVATLALGGAAYALRKDPVIEDPVIEDPVIEEPVIEEPIIDEPIVEEPEEPIIEEPEEPEEPEVINTLINGQSVYGVYLNMNDFEGVIKENLSALEKNTDQSFGRIILDIFVSVFATQSESGAITAETKKMAVGITTYSEIMPLLGIDLPEGVSETDFCLFLSSDNYIDNAFYSSADLVISNGEEDLVFSKGFNPMYFANDGGINWANVLQLISNETVSYQIQPGELITIEKVYNQEVCNLILDNEPFKGY